MLLTVISQMFGVSGKMGDLSFTPQLLGEQFDKDHKVQLSLPFQDRNLKVIYVNEKLLEPTSYNVSKILINEKPYVFDAEDPKIRKEDILVLNMNESHTIVVELS